MISLGEGDTPLLRAAGPTLGSLPTASVGLKAEHYNPTGSFKDRIATVAASLIRQRGLVGAVGTSSGNGGAAMAAYGARAGFPVVLFTVSGIVDGKLRQILAHGATAHVVDTLGTRGDSTSQVAPTIAALAAEHGWLPFLTGGRYLPDAMRGAETIAFELAEQRPDADVVYVPIGGGGLLASIYRGYRRMDVTPPRLVGVQPAGCPTVERALGGVTDPLPGAVTTSISGLQVPVLFDDDTVEAIRASGGWLVEIEDEQAWKAQRVLAREEGMYVEPAGATALAGLLADAATGRIDGEDAVVILSGAGYKDAAATERMGADNPPIPISPDGIAAAFAGFTR